MICFSLSFKSCSFPQSSSHSCDTNRSIACRPDTRPYKTIAFPRSDAMSNVGPGPPNFKGLIKEYHKTHGKSLLKIELFHDRGRQINVHCRFGSWLVYMSILASRLFGVRLKDVMNDTSNDLIIYIVTFDLAPLCLFVGQAKKNREREVFNSWGSFSTECLIYLAPRLYFSSSCISRCFQFKNWLQTRSGNYHHQYCSNDPSNRFSPFAHCHSIRLHSSLPFDCGSPTIPSYQFRFN